MVKKFLSILIISILLFSCQTKESAPEKVVNVTEVEDILKNESNLQVLDVRTP